MIEMTFGSLFAGVGGFDLGMEAAGWKCAWQVEWDKQCQKVLRYYWPTVPKYGDVSTINGNHLAPVDCITFGSPCQDLSVAGKRAGLDGNRSGLFFEAIRIIEEMRDATQSVWPRWAIWENVVGALSSNHGHDFASVLDSLAEAGAVVIEWAVLDAQHFGVPQRRRRVFVIACFDSATADRCPDPLLPVAESLPRNIAKKRTAREGVTTALTKSFGTGGPDSAHALNGWLVPEAVSAVTSKWAKGTGGPSGDECQNLVAVWTKAKRAQSVDDDETWVEGEVAPTLNAFDQGDTRATVIVTSKVRRLTPLECERLMGWPDNHTAVGITDSGDLVQLADSPRYRMIGNGVASPVAAWIARHIAEVNK